MNPNPAATIARRHVRLTAGIILIAAWFVVGSAQAQSRAGRATVGTDAPDVIFHDYCSVCHGEKGDGMSMARFALDPQPVDFTAEKTRKELSRAHMIETLNKGARTKEGKVTAMVSWKKQLSPQHIEAVVDYVIVKFMQGKAAPNDALHAEGREHEHHDHSTANIKAVDYPFGLKPNAQRGKSIYTANCARCHGQRGNGQGDKVQSGPNKARNFRDADFREFASGFSLYSAVSRGSSHMQGWEKILSRQEIADVSEYVLQALIKRRAPATGAK